MKRVLILSLALITILAGSTLMYGGPSVMAITDNTSYSAQSSIIQESFSREGALATYSGGEGWKGFAAGGDGQYLQTRGENPPKWQVIGKLWKLSTSVAVGDSGAYSTENTTTAASHFLTLVPLMANATSANLDASENITVLFTAYYSDNTTATSSYMFTDNSTHIFTPTELLGMFTDDEFIYQIGVKASCGGVHRGTISIGICGVTF